MKITRGSLVRRVARQMLAGMFINGGLDALRNPAPKVTRAERVVEPLNDALGIQTDAETLIRANGAVMVAGGVLLSTGRLPRLASLVLATTLIPTTFAGHAFWAEEDPQTRAQQRTQFFKNASMFGGLLFAALDTGGRPSIPWRAKRAAHKAAEQVSEHVTLPHAA
ncbi:MAG TPA: DoxX family protein [Acidimicrobiia bacterium]|nr:DoxX family protein [Acidimicrobiia bacterium]